MGVATGLPQDSPVSPAPSSRFLFFVLILLFITRYMRPVGPWQRHSRCPLQVSAGLFKVTFSYPEPAYAVIVRYPLSPASHNPPNN